MRKLLENDEAVKEESVIGEHVSVGRKVAVRKCNEYELNRVIELVADIYESSDGPDPQGKKVLIKPNVLNDTPPEKCNCTHPVVIEAVVRYMQSRGATVMVGDSPSIHLKNFRPVKIGIEDVCRRTGVSWVEFRDNPVEIKLRKSKIKVARAVLEADLLISLPKFKNHELVYFSGAIKNTFGIVPGFIKGKQHALHQNRRSFSEFLVDLNEAITADYFLMDGIYGLEGPGPANGFSKKVGLLLGSTNPVALDIIATTIAGYNPVDIPTTSEALSRGKWLSSPEEIIYDGPPVESLIIKDFIKIPVSSGRNISLQFLIRRIKFLRKVERRPVFIHSRCTGCLKCVSICPVNAIKPHPVKKNYIVLTDSKCIRCFCCSEVCLDNAVEIRRKLFGP